MSNRYKITFAYDGTKFSGFQKQPKQRTVEGVITQAVNKMAAKDGRNITIYGSGRTDAGVHALAQTAHFDFPYDLSENQMLNGLNSILPLDIEITAVERVPDDFHARYDVTGKKYQYRLSIGRFIDPFKRNYTAHWRFNYDLGKMQTAANDLIGEHNFSSFVASGAKKGSRVRTIFEASVKLDQNASELIFEFYGNGFMYNQVRIMVGVLLEIGQGKRPVHDVLRLFKAKDRGEARLTMPASGLYLKQVYYPGMDPEHSEKKHHF